MSKGVKRTLEYTFQSNLKTVLLINKMIHIFTLLSLLFLQILSFKEIKPKFCINCKYFITDNNTDKFGRCSLFPKEKNNDIYTLVNGVYEDKIIEYSFCSKSREIDSMCGKEGKMYEKKYIKKRLNEKKCKKD